MQTFLRGHTASRDAIILGLLSDAAAAHAPADTFHKPGFKMHAKILHHLFQVVGGDVIKAPLWDAAALGPAAFPNNAAFVHQHVSQLLATSFPNLRPQQVEVGL